MPQPLPHEFQRRPLASRNPELAALRPRNVPPAPALQTHAAPCGPRQGQVRGAGLAPVAQRPDTAGAGRSRVGQFATDPVASRAGRASRLSVTSRPQRAQAAAAPRTSWSWAEQDTEDEAVRHPATVVDLAAAGGLSLLAAACSAMPSGEPVRAAVVWPFLLLVPGYLLVQACTNAAPSTATRLRHLAAGLGLSPPTLALLALATAVTPWGFHPAAIVGAVTLGCLGLAATAWVRRRRRALRKQSSQPAPPQAPALGAEDTGAARAPQA